MRNKVNESHKRGRMLPTIECPYDVEKVWLFVRQKSSEKIDAMWCRLPMLEPYDVRPTFAYLYDNTAPDHGKYVFDKKLHKY